MKRTFPDLPGWSFEIDEVSASVYQVIGTDEHEHQIMKSGIDPEQLIAECRSEASNMLYSSPYRAIIRDD
jgi:hypothetical protein